MDSRILDLGLEHLPQVLIPSVALQPQTHLVQQVHRCPKAHHSLRLKSFRGSMLADVARHKRFRHPTVVAEQVLEPDFRAKIHLVDQKQRSIQHALERRPQLLPMSLRQLEQYFPSRLK